MDTSKRNAKAFAKFMAQNPNASMEQIREAGAEAGAKAAHIQFKKDCKAYERLTGRKYGTR